MNPNLGDPKSNAQHQHWLDLREAIAADKRQMRLVDAEAVKTARALMVCGALTQTVRALLRSDRLMHPDGYDLNDDEARLLDRVTACLAPTHVGEETAEQAAISKLCQGGDKPIRGTTTQVETGAKIVHQEMVREIRIPGCQPFETFYLFQKRRIQFHWDEKVNFIQAAVIYHSPWMCSTTDPRPIEAAW